MTVLPAAGGRPLGAGSPAPAGAGAAVDGAALGGSDAEVIARSLDEPDAFAELFNRYADDIHRYAARRLGGEAADDLMAETFVIAFQRRRGYDLARPHARPWLYGIVTRLVGQQRRAEARRLRAMAQVASSAAGERSAAAEPMADRVAARVSAEGARGALAGALAALAPRYRDVLLVIAWGDLDYAEAARALGVPVGTVRSRLHRARKKVREALGSWDPAVLEENENENEERDHG